MTETNDNNKIHDSPVRKADTFIKETSARDGSRTAADPAGSGPEDTVTADHLAVTKPGSPVKKFILSGIMLIVAVVITGTMLWKNTLNTGSIITLEMDNANGIEESKTMVKFRSVNVGVVSDITFQDDYKKVLVKVTMSPDTGRLMDKNVGFYVVRPRLETSRISGLDTLLSGSYIQLYTKSGSPTSTKKDHYVVDKDPPVEGTDQPGTIIELYVENPGRQNTPNRLSPGDPVYFQGFKVGSVISSKLEHSPDKSEGDPGKPERDPGKPELDPGKPEQAVPNVKYTVFIFQEYEGLLKKTSKFWVNSGLDVSFGPRGLSLRTEALMNLITGGISFDDFGYKEPVGTEEKKADDTKQKEQNGNEGKTQGEEVEQKKFYLDDPKIYPDARSAMMAMDSGRPSYVVFLPGSLGNIVKGAEVYLKGIVIGHVLEAPFWDKSEIKARLFSQSDIPFQNDIPIKLTITSSGISDAEVEEVFAKALDAGALCASLKSSSIIATKDCISLDFDYSKDKVKCKAANSSGPFQALYHELKVIPMFDSGGLIDSAGSLVDTASGVMLTVTEIVDKVNDFVDKANKFADTANSIELQGLGVDLRDAANVVKNAAAAVQGFMGNADKLVATLNDKKVSGKLPTLFDQLNKAIKSVSVTLDSYNSKSPIYRDIMSAASELSDILKSIKPGMEEIGQSPSSVLFGSDEKDPEPRGSSRRGSR